MLISIAGLGFGGQRKDEQVSWSNRLPRNWLAARQARGIKSKNEPHKSQPIGILDPFPPTLVMVKWSRFTCLDSNPRLLLSTSFKGRDIDFLSSPGKLLLFIFLLRCSNGRNGRKLIPFRCCYSREEKEKIICDIKIPNSSDYSYNFWTS